MPTFKPYDNEGIYFMHFITFLFFYCIFRKVTRRVSLGYPWAPIEHLREEMEEAYGEGYLNRDLRNHLRNYQYLSKIVKLMMLLLLLQTVALSVVLSNKCRWNGVALTLAGHYRRVDSAYRPTIKPPSPFQSSFFLLKCFTFIDVVFVLILLEIHEEYQQFIIPRNYIRQFNRNVCFLFVFCLMMYTIMQCDSNTIDLIVRVFKKDNDIKEEREIMDSNEL